MPATITAIINQKGGTGKTCTCASLGIGLAREGKNVLLVDFDPQSSLTISLGYDKPDDLPVTVATLMMKAMNGETIATGEGISNSHRLSNKNTDEKNISYDITENRGCCVMQQPQ